MHNIYKLLSECKEECEACGIFLGEIANISVNTRAERRWGHCRYASDEDAFYIDISYKLVDDSTPVKTLKETILHELCHTIDEGMCHTGEWKKAVTLLNNKYGYNIKRTNSYADKGVDKEKFPPRRNTVNYVFECIGCGCQISRTRKSKFVEHSEKYHCGICGAKFKRVF
jgi:predicted SprT family Zn-dependent metalloprotease